MHLEIGVVGVRLTGEQGFHLAMVRLLEKRLEGRAGLGNARLIAFGLTELQERDAILEVALQFLITLDRALKLLALAHHLLRRLAIVPEARILRALVQLGKSLLGSIPVKDASAGDLGPP